MLSLINNSEQSVEEIIKNRKAKIILTNSKNYSTAKKVQSLSAGGTNLKMQKN